MQSNQQVTIKINQDTLQRLIRDKALCLTDLHCVNKDSKRIVHQSFLKSAISNRELYS